MSDFNENNNIDNAPETETNVSPEQKPEPETTPETGQETTPEPEPEVTESTDSVTLDESNLPKRILDMKQAADKKLYSSERILHVAHFTYLKDTLIQLGFIAAIIILIKVFVQYPIISIMSNFISVFFAFNASQHWFYGRHSFIYLTNRRILGTSKSEEVDLPYGNIDEVSYKQGQITIITKDLKLVHLRDMEDVAEVLDIIQRRVQMKKRDS